MKMLFQSLLLIALSSSAFSQRGWGRPRPGPPTMRPRPGPPVYPPTPDCPQLMCPECAQGNVIDANGCRTCECLPVRCSGGRVPGCQSPCTPTCDQPAPICIATCKPGGCVCPPDRPIWHNNRCIPQNECPTSPCPGNMVTGCQSACPPSCKDPSPSCIESCRVGGCVCPPETPIWDGAIQMCVTQEKCSPVCPQLRCMECAQGNVIDANGCRTCECLPDPCPMPMCATQCDVYKKDGHGCMTCECECPMIKCAVNCEFGYATDSQGCQTCTCLEDPCKTMTCRPGDVCELFQPRCLTVPCNPKGRCVRADPCQNNPCPPGSVCVSLDPRPCPGSICRAIIPRFTCRPRPSCMVNGCPAGQRCVHPPCRPGVICPPICVTMITCDNVRCPAGTHCEVTRNGAECVPDSCRETGVCPAGQICKEVQCVRAPCPWQCVTSCAVVRCRAGTHCEVTRNGAECVPDSCRETGVCPAGQSCQEVHCVQAPCPWQCVGDADSCAVVDCAPGYRCYVTRNGPECREETCEVLGCPLGQTCKPMPCLVAPCPVHCVREEPLQNPCIATTCLVGSHCEVQGNKPVCVPNDCGPVCAIECPLGNVLDERGCPTCSCIEDRI